MRGTTYIVFLLFISGTLLSFKPETRYLKKAEKSIERGNLKDARGYYQKALSKSPESYDANLGMGLMLCELMDNYKDALPYLEKAISLSQKDTLSDLIYALGKCYQHGGEFEKAISFFDLLNGFVDYDDEFDLNKDLTKRKSDCRYAIDHKYYPPDKNIFLVNAGPKINSEMPEYVPVLTRQNELIFTSKRKDNLREQLNYLDGKYYESMYISAIDSVGFGRVRRYTIPDLFILSHFHKFHESVLSLSPDGKKLFTYRDNKIYEIGIENRWRYKPRKLLRTINFNYYQNHAFITRDGKTLYFTSDADGGLGGNDIYRSVKDEKGNWGPPQNLGAPINTEFDEEAPYVSDDGLLMYFASRGHDGYGNFDIYKSYFLDDKWTQPENLGEPINSPGNDLFMITDSASAEGYVSSSRNGGYGDMDIYKIIFVDKINKQCPAYNHYPLALTIKDENREDLSNRVEVSIPDNYKVVYRQWRINGELTDSLSAVLEKEYPSEGTYQIESKIVALCDTCIFPIVSCNTLENNIRKASSILADSLAVVANAERELQKQKEAMEALKSHQGELNKEQAASIGFDLKPVYFEFNSTKLDDKAIQVLGSNIEVLKKNPQLRIKIIGHSDNRGPRWANNVISQMRAKNVRSVLLGNGVKSSQIILVIGKGSENQLIDCNDGKPCDEAAHAQNRRVEFGLSIKP